MSYREKLGESRTIVIKIGTSTLTNKEGKLDHENLKRLVFEISKLIEEQRKIMVVTSGTIITGSDKLNLLGKLKTISEKQAAAAVGQILLMKEYEKYFGEHGITVAQVLLTRDAISDRERYINARHTLDALLNLGAVPIINENDTVSVDEIKIGDNDNLSALVASLIGADLLLLLTNVEGLIIKGEVRDEVETITPEIDSAADKPGSFGIGGMVTKLQAARISTDDGIPMVVANGRLEGVFEKILRGEKIGTLFIPKFTKLESRKRWLAHGLSAKGRLIVDAGAAKALVSDGSSLLPVGIKNVEGNFEIGDLVSIVNLKGQEIARGLSNYSSREVKKIKGMKTPDIEKILGYRNADEVIRRDNLVVTG